MSHRNFSIAKLAFIIIIVITAVVTAFAWKLFGLKTGLIIGFFVLLSLGGVELLWDLSTRRKQKEVENALYEEARSRLHEQSKDNPTLR